MENLLRNDFTVHHRLPVSATLNISIVTSAPYFEIEDDEHRQTILHFAAGHGIAAYRNSNSYDVTIINYDKFLTGLPHHFQQGKERCDLIVYTTNGRYFLLNELKDRSPKPKVRNKSISQLLSSLQLILTVPSIQIFITGYTIKQCCFFNKQSMSPSTIIATSAFNRLATISAPGLQMSNPAIEALGFEFWEYSGHQVYAL